MKKALDKMNEKQLSKSEAENHRTSKIWHDMKNHMKALEIMMKEKSNTEYEKYLHSLKEQMEKICFTTSAASQSTSKACLSLGSLM